MSNANLIPADLKQQILHQISITKYRALLDEERDWLNPALQSVFAEIERLRAVEAAAYAFADEMADYCSPHNVAADYARRLHDRLNAAGGEQR